MKNFALRTIAVIVAQQVAMIFFMRVVYLGLFLSSALSALTAMVVGLAIYLIQRRTAGSKDGL